MQWCLYKESVHVCFIKEMTSMKRKLKIIGQYSR